MRLGCGEARWNWMDGFLAAHAEAGHLTLVTLDRAIAAKVNGAVLRG